jgi:hypothetical protein
MKTIRALAVAVFCVALPVSAQAAYWDYNIGGINWSPVRYNSMSYAYNYYSATINISPVDNVLSFGNVNSDFTPANADLQALISYLKVGGGSSEAVPEPSTLVLSAAALACLAISRRRFSRR